MRLHPMTLKAGFGIAAMDYNNLKCYNLAKASNALSLIASQSVLKAYKEFQDQLKNTEKNDRLEHECAGKLIIEIRKELGLSRIDDSFPLEFYAAGDPSKNSESSMNPKISVSQWIHINSY